MYPSNTIHFRSAWNPKDDDDDLSTLSGSTATTLFRPQFRQHHTSLEKNANSDRKRLNSYLAKQRKDPVISDVKDTAIQRCAYDGLVDKPFDEVTHTTKQSTANRTFEGPTNGGDDNSGESCCERWEVQSDGNLEPVISTTPPFRRNRFEKSSKSAFVSTTDCTKRIGAYSASARIERRNRLEKIKQRQGGRLGAKPARQLKKPTEAKTSREVASNTPPSEPPVPKFSNKSHIHSISSDHELTLPSISSKMVSQDGGANFESNLSKLKLKLDTAKSVLGTQSELLCEVSRKYKTDEFSARERQQLMNKTKQLKKALPYLPSQVKPTCNSIKTLPNVNTMQSSSKVAPSSPGGSSFTNSTRTTECTSATSPTMKHAAYAYMIKDNIQKLEFPSPKSPDCALGRTSSPEELTFEELLSPPGLRRRREFPIMGDSIDQNHNEREDENEYPLGNMSLCDEHDITRSLISQTEGISCGELENDSVIVESEPNKAGDTKKVHKINLTFELSGNSLETLEEIIRKMKLDMDGYKAVDESVSITTSCDRHYNSKSSRAEMGNSFETHVRSNQTPRPLRLLESSSQSIVEGIRTAIHEATF